jgi:DNA methylase
VTTAEPLDLRLQPPPGGQILHQSDRCTVVWGDCRDPAVIAACPRGYGLLLTDPPYGIGYRSDWAGRLTLPRGRSHERVTFGVHRKKPSHRDEGRGGLAARLRQGSVLTHPNNTTRHPTEKPVPLMADLIESSTVRGDLVVDPCAGSGPVAVAAVILGRRAWVVELDRAHAETTVDRVRAAERIADLIEDA